MNDPAFQVTYRVGMANLNAFFGTWLKRTWFDRTSRRRFLLYWAIVTALIGIGLRSFIADKHMWQSDLVINLIGGALGGIAFLLYSAVITFVLTQVLGPPLIYLAQTATFAFGPMRKRVSRLRATPVGVDKTTDETESRTKWRDFTAVVETKRTVLLFTSRNSATIVPKSAFASPSEADAFAAFAKARWKEAHSVF